MDVDDIADWPWAKLQRWMIYDEVIWMAKALREVSKNMTDAEVFDEVRKDQAKHDWIGIFKAGGVIEVD